MIYYYYKNWVRGIIAMRVIEWQVSCDNLILKLRPNLKIILKTHNFYSSNSSTKYIYKLEIVPNPTEPKVGYSYLI